MHNLDHVPFNSFILSDIEVSKRFLADRLNRAQGKDDAMTLSSNVSWVIRD
jgi:hypothetical protein